MIDAVLSYHMNPLTCGVAKFNQQLAERLGVPHADLSDQRFRRDYVHPLVSIKASEVAGDWLKNLPIRKLYSRRADYTLLLHDRPEGLPTPCPRIMYADELGIPATIHGNPKRGAYRVLTFGMAHKRLWPHYRALKVHLEAEHPDYTVEMSTAIHDGHPWEDGLAQAVAGMRGIFGDHLRVLGFLGDDALAKELQDCDAVAVYFDPAFRANNTTAWAAIDAGKVLYTNRDEHSPPDDFDHSWETLVSRLCEK